MFRRAWDGLWTLVGIGMLFLIPLLAISVATDSLDEDVATARKIARRAIHRVGEARRRHLDPHIRKWLEESSSGEEGEKTDEE